MSRPAQMPSEEAEFTFILVVGLIFAFVVWVCSPTNDLPPQTRPAVQDDGPDLFVNGDGYPSLIP